MNHRWLRLSLRTLLVAITVLSIWLAIETHRARRQKAAIDAILAAGGRIHYEHQLTANNIPTDTGRPMTKWLAAILGNEYFYRVKLVTLYPTAELPADEQVKMLTGIAYLPQLAIWPGGKGASTLADDAAGGLTDAGMASLPGIVPSLEHMSLSAAPITDAGILHLHGLTKLNSLQLGNAHVCTEPALATFKSERPSVNVH